MHLRTLKAFEEELGAIEKNAIDPGTLASLAVGGKYLANNILHEYGHHVPILRRLASEVAGVGARTGMQGKPMLSAPLRHLARISGEGQLMGLYEKAHQTGRLTAGSAGQGLSNLKQLALQSNIGEHFPAAKKYLQMAENVPLEHGKGWAGATRKAVDYGFTPVGQVWKRR